MKHLLLFGALALTTLLLPGCQKTTDPSPATGSAPVAAPAVKSHTLSFCYTTVGLDKSPRNLGASVWLTVDKTPLMLGSVVDPPFYMTPWDQSMESYSQTRTITGTTLTVEARFDNVYGTPAQPRDLSGAALSLPATASLMVVPVIDGKLYTDRMTRLSRSSTSGTFSYANGTNPSSIFKVDLTKL